MLKGYVFEVIITAFRWVVVIKQSLPVHNIISQIIAGKGKWVNKK